MGLQCRGTAMGSRPVMIIGLPALASTHPILCNSARIWTVYDRFTDWNFGYHGRDSDYQDPGYYDLAGVAD
jgi:hypothetical protein